MKTLLFLLLVLLSSAHVVLACTCVPPKNAAEELKGATAVFSGKVLRINDREAVDIFEKVEAVFEVEKVWKGVDEKNISVFTSSQSAACGYGFEEGRTYLVYAYANREARLTTSICSRTKRLKDAREDLEELGPGKTVTKSENENEVQELARQFAQRLKETREFGPDVRKLFIERFVECHLRAEIEGKENAIFMQISASIPPEIASQAREEELRSYLLAQLNFFHLETLHRMSTRELEGKWGDSFYPPEQAYPPGVYDLLMKNPAIASAAEGEKKDRVSISASIRNVDQLRSIMPTLERAMLAMREYFMAHPPEETETYKKNMDRIGNREIYGKFWEVSSQEISKQNTKEGKRCLGFSARMLAVVKVPPFYRLVLFQDGKRFKLASLYCTEPPCVD